MSNIYDPKRTGSNIISSTGGKGFTPAQSDLSRILPRQLSTGTMRGTQNVGYGTAKIDGSNNRITIGAPDGSTVGLGNIPNTNPAQYGFFTQDANGKVIMTFINGRMTVYDTTNTTRFEAGVLPNGTYGAAGSNDGFSVEDGFDV